MSRKASRKVEGLLIIVAFAFVEGHPVKPSKRYGVARTSRAFASRENSKDEYLDSGIRSQNSLVRASLAHMMLGLNTALRLRGGLDEADASTEDLEHRSPEDLERIRLRVQNFCLCLWFLGNFFYQLSNKMALEAAGGARGFPLTIASSQLAVGVLYALYRWSGAAAEEIPRMSWKNYIATLPAGAMTAGAYAASAIALSAGAFFVAQIVKTAEPAFVAVIGALLYGIKISVARWLSLILLIGGVCLALRGVLNSSGTLPSTPLGTRNLIGSDAKTSRMALFTVMIAFLANVFSALRVNERIKLLSRPGLAERMGWVGNQVAINDANALIFILPIMLYAEGHRLKEFMALTQKHPRLRNSLVSSGFWFFVCTKLGQFLTLKTTSSLFQSVTMTINRVIVVLIVALVTGESLTATKLLGAVIGIGGLLLYSIIDEILAARRQQRVGIESEGNGDMPVKFQDRAGS